MPLSLIHIFRELEAAHQKLHALAEDADDGEKRRHHQERVRAQARHEAHHGGQRAAHDLQMCIRDRNT